MVIEETNYSKNNDSPLLPEYSADALQERWSTPKMKEKSNQILELIAKGESPSAWLPLLEGLSLTEDLKPNSA